MKRTVWVLSLFLLAGVLAWAATLTILSTDGLTGGGAASSGGSFRLAGAIDGLGLPDGYAALSQGGGLRLEVGQQAAFAAPGQRNAADPAWLRAPNGL